MERRRSSPSTLARASRARSSRTGGIARLAPLAFATAFALAHAQTAKTYRVGWLDTGPSPSPSERAQGDFQLAMKDLGYAEGRNLVVEYRYAGGDAGKLRQLAGELASANVDVIVAAGDSAALAAKRASSAIPVVVMEVASDPVASGIVSSLARPEANVTGVVTQSEELWGKRLSVFRQLVPPVRRAAVLLNPSNPTNRACEQELRTTAPAHGIAVEFLPVPDAGSIDVALGNFARGKVGADLRSAPKRARAPDKGAAGKTPPADDGGDAIFVCWDGVTLANAGRIADFAIKHRLPTLAPFKEYVEAGMLMSLGTDLPAHRRRGAFYVDRLLKGGKPGALPVERPVQFDFVVNLRTAKALGLNPPAAILNTTDDLIR